ncbi:MAG: carboxylesterase family protein [Clostridia bacterium]|nr:carboxylesterase family protein [Clostridia bacterium]
MKFKKAFLAFLILFLAAFAFLFEFGRNTVWGWCLAGVLFAAFFILHGKVLSKRKIGFRLLSWLVFLALTLGVMKISAPPVKLIPAVDVKDPVATDVVSVAQGDLTGVLTEDGSVEVYTGIPYAKPPVGELRWVEPQPPEKWDGVRVCDHFAPASMQQQGSVIVDSLTKLVGYRTFRFFDPTDNYVEPVSEDSLYLNIWKPSGDVKNAPVLFFIHGGSLTGGQTWYGEYNGESLARKGLIVVNCAYRLNVFGYYANEELAGESPNGTTGNYGLLDQIAALKWVNDNISAFGGDPSKITIAGESAGASSVNAICVSPQAKGLFRYAIAESSGITAKKPYHTFRAIEDALDTGDRIMREFGVSDIAGLRGVPAEKLVNTEYINSAMTVDGYAIREMPYLTYEKGENNETALLNGFNAHEADVFCFMRKVEVEDYGEALFLVLGGEYAKDGRDLVPPEPLDKAYSLPIVEQGGGAKGSYNKIVSAAWFNYSHFNWSRLLSAKGTPVYEYYFTKYNKGLAANHGGEMPYAYGNLHRHGWLYTDDDARLSEQMQEYWVNFVSTGNPNGEGLPEWKRFNDEPGKIMELGDRVGMIDEPYLDIYEVIDKYQDH